MEYAHKSLIILIIRRRRYILDTSYPLLFVERFVFGHGGGEKLEKVELRYANMRQHRKRNILWWRDASNNGAFIIRATDVLLAAFKTTSIRFDRSLSRIHVVQPFLAS